MALIPVGAESQKRPRFIPNEVDYLISNPFLYMVVCINQDPKNFLVCVLGRELTDYGESFNLTTLSGIFHELRIYVKFINSS